MAAYDYELMQVRIEDGVARATVNAPPMNVMTLPLFGELSKFGAQVGDDDDVRVVGLDSADPYFFIAHVDVDIAIEDEQEFIDRLVAADQHLVRDGALFARMPSARAIRDVAVLDILSTTFATCQEKGTTIQVHNIPSP